MHDINKFVGVVCMFEINRTLCYRYMWPIIISPGEFTLERLYCIYFFLLNGGKSKLL